MDEKENGKNKKGIRGAILSAPSEIAAGARKFPAVYIIGAIGAAVTTLTFVSDDIEKFMPFTLASMWSQVMAVMLSMAAGALKEKPNSKIAANAIALAVFVPVCVWCRSQYDNEPYFPLTYFSTICAVMLACGFLAAKKHREKAAAHLSASLSVAGIITGCVSASLEIILTAINTLFGSIDEGLFVGAAAGSAFLVFMPMLAEGETKEYEEIRIPKAVLFSYKNALLPLFAVYIAVLYAYLLKSAVIRKMPSNMINIFVSIATASFIELRMTLGAFGGKAVGTFRKYGAYALVPLVIVQCAAWGIRVCAYGLTTARYASLLYIIFSVLCILGAIISNFRAFDIDKWSWLILAFFMIFACLPRVNVIDLPEFQQASRIERVLKAHNLLRDGKIDVGRTDAELSDEEKTLIHDAWGEISNVQGRIGWLENIHSANDFGFEPPDYSKSREHTFVDAEKNEWINVRGFSRIRKIDGSSWDGTRFTITAGGIYVDITDELLAVENSEEPLLIDKDGMRIVITAADASEYGPRDKKRYYSNAVGYILE